MQEVELRVFFRMLRQQRWAIAATIAFCLLCSVLLTLLVIKREYKASTTLLYSQSGVTSAAGAIAGSLGLPLSVSSTGPAAWFETILTSRNLARKMVRKYNLVPVLGAKDETEAVAKLLERIVITAKPESNAVLVAVKIPGSPIRMPGRGLDKDRAQVAADIANSLVAELDYWMKTTDYQSSAKQRKFIQNQLQQVLGRVAITREQLTGVFKRTGVFAPDAQGQQWLQALGQLETDLAATRAELRGTEIAQEAGRSPDELKRLAAAAAQDKTEALIADLRKQIADLEVQVRREQEVNHKTADHPDVAQLQQSLSELRAKLNTELAIVNQAESLAHRKLSDQLSLGEERWSQLRSLIANLPQQGLEVEALKKELEGATDLGEMLTKQLLMAEIAEEQQSQNFNVLDPAEAPRQPTSPSLVLSVLVGGAVGAVLGLLLAAARYFLSTPGSEGVAGDGRTTAA